MTDSIDPSALQPVLLSWTTILRSFKTIQAITEAYAPLVKSALPEEAEKLFAGTTLEDLDRGSHLIKRLNPAVATPGANWRTDLDAMDAIVQTLAPTALGLADLITQSDLPSSEVPMLKEAIPELSESVATYRSLRESF